MASKKLISKPEEILSILDEIESDDSEFEDGLEEELSDSGSCSDPDYLPDNDEQEEILQTRAQEAAAAAAQESRRSKGGKATRRQTEDRQQSNDGQPAAKRTKNTSASASRQELSSDDLIVKPSTAELTGKSGKVWQTESSVVPGKTSAINVVHSRPGPQPSTNFSDDILDCFELFFTEHIVIKILVNTNIEISKQRKKFKDQNSANVKDATFDEIRALLGLLILTGAMKNNHLSVDYLFNDTYTGTRYLATMSRVRFEFVVNCLRFDDRDSRDQSDPLAPVRKIWEELLAGCKKHFKPGPYVTIDEQLIVFRGRCKFKMYIPSKPGRYGIKVVMMCDAGCFYMVDGIVYIGKGSVPSGIPAAEFYVTSLVESIKGSNRNVTMDNWFTSVPLVEKLKTEYSLTVIGTVKKNKTELPKEFVDVKYQSRKTGSSMFLFDEKMTAVSYKAKDNKLVCLLSSAHETASVNDVSGKPEIVLNYNQTKGGVDVLDQMCRGTNVIRKTRRWPLTFFYNMLNIAVVNAHVIYVHNFYRKKSGGKPLSKVEFMLSLYERLAFKWLEHRYALPNQHRQLKLKIGSLLESIRPSIPRPGRSTSASVGTTSGARSGQPQNPTQSGASGAKRGYCEECSYKLRRKASKRCAQCSKMLCGEHQVVSCNDCATETDT